jgi:hypothetical protein
METYDIIIHSVGCSGPGLSEMWVALLNGEELTAALRRRARIAGSGCIADGNVANATSGIGHRHHDGRDWCACKAHRR